MDKNQEKSFDKTLKNNQTNISASETLAIPKEKLDFAHADPRLWQKGEVIEGLYEVRAMTSGGMGDVYFVNHNKWNIMLAVKSPNLKMLRDENNIKRFIREAESWIDLGKHPNVATCFYVRIIEGIPRIFIEYVDGGNLKKWMEKGKLENLEDILDIAIQISEGMTHAHNQTNLIHRDLKPANVLLTKDGTAKITDFGLVRRTGQVEIPEREKIVSVPDSMWETMTMTGTRVGTPAYMSPEQWDAAHEAGREADIYSFGIMLYEMLCSKKPFELTEQEKKMHPMAQAAIFERKHKEEKIPAITRELPASLSNVVIKCLEMSPDNRHHSFEDLRDQLKSIYLEINGIEYPRKILSEVELKADDLNNRALSLIDLNKQDIAIECWKYALQLNPLHMESVFNNGYWQWHNGIITDEQYLDLIKDLGFSVDNNSTYWHSLGLIQLERGNLEESLQAIKKAIELRSIDASVLNALGLAYLGLEDFENAKRAFKKAVASQDNWHSRLYLAEVLFKFGDEQAFRKEVDILLCNPLYKNALEIQGITDKNKAVQYVKTCKIRRIGLINKFFNHQGDVYAVAFSANCTYALSGDHIGIANLWDITTGENIKTLTLKHKFRTPSKNSLAFSPDGRYILTGGMDETARLWDIETGNNIKTFIHKGHPTICYVMSVAFSSDGRYALTGITDNTVRLWDITTGENTKTLTGHTAPVNSVAFSLDAIYVLTGSYDNTVRLWDITSGENIKTIFTGSEGSVAFSPDGKYALTGSDDYTAKLWDITTGENIKVFTGHTQSVDLVAFSPDGKYVLTGSDDHTAKLWDIKTGRNIRTLIRHTHVKSVAFSPDGRHVIIGSDYKAFLLETINSSENIFVFMLCKPINVQQSYSEEKKAAELINKASTLIKMNLFSEAYEILRQIQTFRGFERAPEILKLLCFCAKKGKRIKLRDAWQKKKMIEHPLVSVIFSPDGKYALTGGKDNTARLWDITTSENIKTFTGHKAPVDSVAFSLDGRYALTGSKDDNTARLWDLKIGKNIKTFRAKIGFIEAVVFSSDFGYVFTIDDKGKANLWDIMTAESIKTFYTGNVNSVAFSSNGRYALTGGKDKTAKLWDITTGKSIKTFYTGNQKEITISYKSSYVNSVAFSSDCRYVLTGGEDKTAKLWDIKTGENIKTLCTGNMNSVAFTPDGRYVLTGGYDTARLWDIKTDEKIKKLYIGHVKSVVFSPDGRYALTGGEDNIVRLWNIATGENIKTLTGHTAPVSSVAFSPDGKYALTGSKDNTVKQWDITIGENIKTLTGHTAPVNSVVFSPDGRYALTGGEDKAAMLWDITTGENVKIFTGHNFPVNSVAFSPDGRYVLTGGYSTAMLWDITTGENIKTWNLLNHMNVAAFSPDGKYALIGEYKTAKLWDISTGKSIKELTGHIGLVNSVTFSPDGKYALTGCEDKFARLWDITTGENIKILTGHKGSVKAVAFSPDGKHALTGSEDNTAMLWDIMIVENIKTWRLNKVDSVAFSPDGRYALTGSRDKTLRLWEFDWELEFPDDKNAKLPEEEKKRG